jgi:hypothetical protein
LAQADEFLFHGLRYVFPPKFGGEARGVPTAWAARPLSDELSGFNAPPPVWAHSQGQIRGIALEPFHPVVPVAALRDPELHERFALADALRFGEVRVRKAARAALFGRAAST